MNNKILLFGGLGLLGVYLWSRSTKEAKASDTPSSSGDKRSATTQEVTATGTGGTTSTQQVTSTTSEKQVDAIGPRSYFNPDDLGMLGDDAHSEGFAAGQFDAEATAAEALSSGGASVFALTPSSVPEYDVLKGETWDAAYRDGFAQKIASYGLVLDGDPLSGDAMVYAPASASTDGDGTKPGSFAVTDQAKVLAEQAGLEDGSASVALSESRGGMAVEARHDRWKESWQGTEAAEAYRVAFQTRVSSLGYLFDGTYVSAPTAAGYFGTDESESQDDDTNWWMG